MTQDEKQPRLYLQAGTEELSLALEHVMNGGAHGLVLTGSESASIRSLREARSDLSLMVDAGRWRLDFAGPGRPLDLLDQSGFFGYTLDNYVDDLEQAGATTVLAPCLAIRGRDWKDRVPEALKLMDGASHAAFRTHLALESSILDPENVEGLASLLRSFGRTVNITVLGAQDALARKDRLQSLRILQSEGLIEGVLATEPVVATDAIAHGVATVSIGVISSLRVPQMPGHSGRRARNWEPGVFSREILEIRSPAVFAAWYIGRPTPERCDVCGCVLTRYERARHDEYVNHTIHAASGFVLDLLEVDTAQQKSWIVQERATAMSKHPLAAVDSVPSKILKQLIVLDRRAASLESVQTP